MIAPETAIAPLTITLFGPMLALVQGKQLPRLRSRKGHWLLALLTLRHGRPIEREWLAGTLWPDMDQSQAFDNLRPVLSELRKALGGEGERLQSPNRRTLLLNLTGAAVDVLAFDAAIASKNPLGRARAVSLYRGPLLEGCAEEWVVQDREAREQDCLRALQELADAALTAGDYSASADYFRRAASMNPWRDEARRGLMEALDRSGDRNAALQVYREFVELLRSDPRATPDEKTTALYARLRAEARRQAISLPVPREEAKAAPTISGYLPHPLTELIGREDERLEVAARLRRARLVTLTGPGGIGKTRLAIEVAAEVVAGYSDGVWLVALESLADGNQVVEQIASVFGVKEEANRPLLQSLTDALRKKRLLLVLDNCEHVLKVSAQAAEHLLRECAGVRILATSREALGITGETAWAVPALAVPEPVHLPEGNATRLRVLMSYESVQLFVERAQAALKTFALTGENAKAVAQVCFHVEGIPLAIELAAARVTTLTVEQIATRLHSEVGLLTGGSRTARTRQQTLRATLDWSYALLSEAEGLLLARLSAFAEGWSLEAAEQVCSGSGIERNQTLDLLTSLADKSLVAFGEREAGGRYRLLEMVRQYGAEKLTATNENHQVKARHRDYFLALAEEAEPEFTGAEQGVWLARLEAERANLRAALDWCKAETNGAKAGLQLAGALYQFWEMHGHYSEGRAYLSESLARDGAGERNKERARALSGAGALAYYQGDYPAAQSLQEEGLSIFRELGNRQGVAWSLNNLGDVAGAQGNNSAARSLYEESLVIFREVGNRQGAASMLHHLGRIVREQGNYAEARKLYEESLTIVRELGNRQNVAWSLHHIGNVAAAQGDHAAAWALQEEGLTIFRELGNGQGVAWSLNDLGDVASALGDSDAARSLYEESLAIFRELGNRQGVASLLHRLGRIALEQGDPVAALSLQKESRSIFQELGNRQGYGWSLNGLGRIAFEQGNYAEARSLHEEGIRILEDLGDKRGVAECLEGLAAVILTEAEAQTAVRLWGAASALRESLNAPLSPLERERFDRYWEQARRLLGENAFDAAWTEGHSPPSKRATADAPVE